MVIDMPKGKMNAGLRAYLDKKAASKAQTPTSTSGVGKSQPPFIKRAKKGVMKKVGK